MAERQKGQVAAVRPLLFGLCRWSPYSLSWPPCQRQFPADLPRPARRRSLPL